LKYRILGKTKEKVSVLGFGCMRLPVIGGDMKEIDTPEAVKLIRYAIDQGVNYLDTAYTYHGGHSEEVVAQALQGGYRQKVFLATKLPVFNVKESADMDKYLDIQLDRLQTDRIDFYLVHTLNRNHWARMKDFGLLDFLRRAQSSGKVKHLGFSFHDEFEIFREIVDSFPWSFCQIQYNYLDENYQAGKRGLQYAAQKGLGVIVMEPLRGGVLADGLTEKAQAVVKSCPTIQSGAELALRWVWQHSEVGMLLSGMNNMEHVSENLSLADKSDIPLTPAENEAVLAIQKIYAEKIQIDCTACKYCLPCASGVDIPQVFQYYNQARMLDDVKGARYWYNNIGKASNCSGCGRCETHCPQNIPIREKLKEIQSLFETDEEALPPSLRIRNFDSGQ